MKNGAFMGQTTCTYVSCKNKPVGYRVVANFLTTKFSKTTSLFLRMMVTHAPIVNVIFNVLVNLFHSHALILCVLISDKTFFSD